MSGDRRQPRGANVAGWRLIGTAGLLAVLVVCLPRAWDGATLGVGEEQYLRWSSAPVAEALGAFRPVEGRLSGGFGYGHFPTLPTAEALKRAQAAYRAIGNGETARARDFVNRAQLALIGSAPEAAAELIRRAVSQAPGEAELESDQSAILIARAAHSGRAEDLLDSLDAADRALAMAPLLLEARFNRALACERLFLDSEAAAEWRRYLTTEPVSPWSEEARQHLEAIERRRESAAAQSGAVDRLAASLPRAGLVDVAAAVKNDPQAARELVEERLLSDWAEAELKADRDHAKQVLAAAATVAAILLETSGDPFTSEIVAVIKDTVAANNEPNGSRAGRAGDRLAILIRGHLLLGRGKAHLRAHRIGEAAAELSQAASSLGAGESPAQILADLQLAICKYQHHQATLALGALHRLAADPRLARYPSVSGRVYWMIGLAEQQSGSASAVAEAYQRALELFRQAREEQSEAAAETLLAEALELVGRASDAWTYRRKALAWSATQPPTQTVYNILDETVISLLQAGRTSLALYFQGRLVVVAARLAGAEEMAMTHLRRARIAHALGHDEEASSDLFRAQSLLARVVDVPTRDQIQAEADLVASEMLGTHNPRAAITALDRAVEFQRRSGASPLLPALLRARARLYSEIGALDLAESDLESGVEEIERQRARTAAFGERIPLFDQAQPIFEALIEVQYRQGKTGAAFETAERCRARTLMDNRQKASSTASAAAVARRLPAHTTLVEYAVAGGKLVTWVVTPAGVMQVPGSPSFDAVEHLAEAVLDSLRHGEDQRGDRLLASLHRVLIGPWHGGVAAGDTLVFVPVDALYKVPFAALWDGETGRFVVEDHAVVVAPSAFAYLDSVARERAWAAAAIDRNPAVLVVGDPDVTAPGQAELPPLPAAAVEAAEIASLYPGSQLLLHAEATREHLLAAVADSDLVHIATHTNDARNPSRSRLVLATTAKSGIRDLSSIEVAQLHLPRTLLVVLAGCATGEGRLSRSEGALSLAYSFLSAAVPTVLSTLWDVDDSATAPLLLRFHQLLRGGAPPVTALQQTQREALGSRRSANLPWTWASLELVGSGEQAITQVQTDAR